MECSSVRGATSSASLVLCKAARSAVAALEYSQICECNGIAIGCTQWRMGLFRQLPPPWFMTVAELRAIAGTLTLFGGTEATATMALVAIRRFYDRMVNGTLCDCTLPIESA